MKSRITISGLVSSPQLLGPHFAGASWQRWKAVLKAAFAEPMSATELALFAEVAGGRAPPARRVKELICAIGRGGGKDSAATAVAAHLAATSDFSALRPGERAFVLLIAVDRDQARIAFNYLKGYFETVPALASLVERITDDGVDLRNGATIQVTTNNMRSPRGRTVCAAIYDEVSFWFSEEYSNPDVEVDAAITPGLMRFPGSIKILISSVHAREGLLYDRIARYLGKDDDDHLAILGTSLQFNPTLDAAEIERQIAIDPDRMSAEYLSVWRSDISSFIDRALVDAATDKGVAVRPYDRAFYYLAAADPSGGRQDSFTFCITHRDGDKMIVDAVREFRPPFTVEEVISDIAALCRIYRISKIFGDAYGADLTVQAFKRVRLSYETPHLEQDGPKLNRSAIYLNALPLFAGGCVRLLDVPRLGHQLTSLRRRVGRGNAKDTVDHPPGAHDDLANATCLALVLAAAKVSRPYVPSADRLNYLRGLDAANRRAAGMDAAPYYGTPISW